MTTKYIHTIAECGQAFSEKDGQTTEQIVQHTSCTTGILKDGIYTYEVKDSIFTPFQVIVVGILVLIALLLLRKR